MELERALHKLPNFGKMCLRVVESTTYLCCVKVRVGCFCRRGVQQVSSTLEFQPCLLSLGAAACLGWYLPCDTPPLIDASWGWSRVPIGRSLDLWYGSGQYVDQVLGRQVDRYWCGCWGVVDFQFIKG